MNPDEDEIEEDEGDRRFDEAVQAGFAEEGLLVTHYFIIVEVLQEDGGTRLVYHSSDNLSIHLRLGMLHSAVEFHKEGYDEEGDDE